MQNKVMKRQGTKRTSDDLTLRKNERSNAMIRKRIENLEAKGHPEARQILHLLLGFSQEK